MNLSWTKVSNKTSDRISLRISGILKKSASRKFSAFTLAELIVVVSILAVLATIGFLALSGYQKDAKKAVASSNVRSVYAAISSESAVTGYSSRYYVVHDPLVALSGAVVVFDGHPASLVGGNWDAPGTNYSAGNPDYAKLKLDPEKFRITSSGTRTAGLFAAAFPGFPPFGDSASAEAVPAADPSYLLVGAADATDASGGKDRVRSYTQVAALLPSGETAVTGDYPVSASGGSTPGLILDTANPSGTGALIDGATVGSVPGCDAASVSGYEVPVMESGRSEPVSRTVDNGTVNATAYCSFGALSVSSEAATCADTYVPVAGPACAKNECGGTAPSAEANTESNSSSQTLGTDWHYSATAGTCTYACASGYSWDGSSCRKDCDPVSVQTWSGTAYALSSVAALAHGASGNFSGSGSFGGSYPTNGTLTAAFALSCSDGALSSAVTQGTGSCQDHYSWNSSWTAPVCTVDSFPVSGSFGASASGATVSGCAGKTATATSTGAFSFGNVDYGTDCSSVTATKTNYTCSTGTNGPASLTAAVSNVSGGCAAGVRTFACADKPAAGTDWNTVSSYQQTWNGSAWAPADSATAHNDSASSTACNYKCSSGYGWDAGTSACRASVNGTCGTAAKAYANAASSYGSDTFCALGNGVATPTVPTFPGAGASVTWTCGGNYGGSASPTCTASRAAAANCAASAQSVNGHSYSVPAFNHGTTTPATSAAVAVTWGTQTYSQTFSCTNGTVATSGSETANATSCFSGYSLIGGVCVPANCKAIRTAYPTSTDGSYSIDPDGTWPNAAFTTYCDMNTDGGGWTLAGYSYAGSTAVDASNQNFRSLKCWGGTFTPTSRGTSSAAIAALPLAKWSTEVAFSISTGGASVTTGGIGSYTTGYKFSIPNPSALTFDNHSYLASTWGTTAGACVAVTVNAIKGTVWSGTRYTKANSLGTSWSDSYPTGYGAVDNSSCIQNWDYGIFISSIHSGHGHASKIGTVANECDVSWGSYTYTHRGNSTHNWTGVTGSTAIWFR